MNECKKSKIPFTIGSLEFLNINFCEHYQTNKKSKSIFNINAFSIINEMNIIDKNLSAVKDLNEQRMNQFSENLHLNQKTLNLILQTDSPFSIFPLNPESCQSVLPNISNVLEKKIEFFTTNTLDLKNLKVQISSKEMKIIDDFIQSLNDKKKFEDVNFSRMEIKNTLENLLNPISKAQIFNYSDNIYLSIIMASFFAFIQSKDIDAIQFRNDLSKIDSIGEENMKKIEKILNSKGTLESNRAEIIDLLKDYFSIFFQCSPKISIDLIQKLLEMIKKAFLISVTIHYFLPSFEITIQDPNITCSHICLQLIILPENSLFIGKVSTTNKL